MKILFVSMRSVHAVRWIENLKDTPYELYWFDVLGRGQLKTTAELHQFTNWKKRKLPYIKGEYWLRKNIPFFYELLQPFMEVTANEQLDKIIQKILPDVIHSFEMQNCSYPIFKTMNKFKNIKWIYSCWGTDLFYYKNFKAHNLKIRQILGRIDFLHTDCRRDYEIAKSLGFNGKYLGVIPGGTGYNLNALEMLSKPLKERKIILVKGYQHQFGRAIFILKALEELRLEIQNYKVVFFGAHQNIINYIEKNKLNFIIYPKDTIGHQEILKLMGESLLYIGNSISDGIPNTLLEAITMGAFPIQSNPGGVTEEIINDSENGFLINDPSDIKQIKQLILNAITDKEMIEKALFLNKAIAVERLDYYLNQQKVIAFYQNINS